MEWVVTTGRTIEDAKDAALDQLGVDEQDAEFEILEEPRTGLFGRTRGEARVRARIQPAAPRAKVERRDRRRKSGDGERSGDGKRRSGGGQKAKKAGAAKAGSTPKAGRPGNGTSAGAGQSTRSGGKGAAKGSSSGGSSSSDKEPRGKTATVVDSDQPSKPRRERPGNGKRAKPEGEQAAAAESKTDKQQSEPGAPIPGANGENAMSEDVNVDEQADLMETFLAGLLEAFGANGTIEREKVDDDTIELRVGGDDLGLLIGPKGQTLQAVQELARTYVQRKASGTHHGRVRIDIGGYRERRREALARFTEQVAQQVIDSGAQRALEPMNAADRKVVHDTANDIDGVRTTSEGEEPRRRVVISPA